MVANKPTIKDVARQAGVSIATVSRVMAKKANTYTPQTAQRVWDAAAKLGYQKNSAAVAASDLVAMGIMRQAAQMGIKIPQDLSIVSIDGTFLCEVTDPQLTSVTQDFYQIGVNSVLDLLGNAPSELVPFKLVERGSVAEQPK